MRIGCKFILPALLSMLVAYIASFAPLHFSRPNSMYDNFNILTTPVYSDLEGVPAEKAKKKYAFCNFDRSICCDGTLNYPTNTAEVVELVKSAAKNGRKVRVVGGGHSMYPLVCTPHVKQEPLDIVVLDYMQDVLSIEHTENGGIVTVEAGIRLRHLNNALAYAGLAMSNLGLIDEQSIAGATATGTHGSGIALPSISNAIVGMEIVTANGTVLVLSSESEAQKELLSYAKINLGLFGVVTKITMSVRKAFLLRRQHKFNTLENAWADLEKSTKKYRNYQFWLVTGTNIVLENYIDEIPRTPENLAKVLPQWRLVFEAYKTDVLFHILTSIGWLFPKLQIAKGLPFVEPEWEFIARSDQILNWPGINYHSVRYSEEEFFVPIQDARRGFDAIKEWNADPANYDCLEVSIHPTRFVKGDDLPLSPSKGVRATVAMSYVLLDHPRFPECARRVEKRLKEFNARPHWGKRHTLTSEDVKRLYGAKDVARFVELVKQLDPTGVFATPKLKSLFEGL